MDIEEKVHEIIGACFNKLRNAFEEEGLELGYEQEDYVEELILNEINKS
jgi:hypothetical protein